MPPLSDEKGAEVSDDKKIEKVLFGVPEVAAAISMDVKSVRKACEAGQIPGQRIGRVWKIPAWWILQQRDGVPQQAA